jgi:glycosyltransferase involved in cell wall biosynthesis
MKHSPDRLRGGGRQALDTPKFAGESSSIFPVGSQSVRALGQCDELRPAARPSKPRILQVFPPGWNFHTPESVLLHATELSSSILLGPGLSLPPEFPTPAETLHAGFTVLANSAGVGVGKIVRINRLGSVLRQAKPDVIVTYEVYSSVSFQLSLAAKGIGAKHIVFCYETIPAADSLWNRFPLTALFVRRVVESADMFLVHTDRARRALNSLNVSDSRIRAIQPGLSVDAFSEDPRSEPPLGRKFVVSYMGPLHRNKGIETLLRAYDEFRPLAPGDTELWIAGDGPLRSSVIQRMRGDESIRYFGYLLGSSKRGFLSGTSVFVYPSEDQRVLGWTRWEEQLGVSVLEAMLAGCAVLVSDSGALPEIAPSTSSVFRQKCSSSLSQSLYRLYKNRDTASREGKSTADRAHSMTRMSASVRQVTEAIQSLGVRAS